MFGMRKQARSPYGLPGPISGFGGGTWNTDGTQATPVQRMAEEGAAAPSPEPVKPGLFGRGGVGRGIAGTVGDFLLQYNGMNPIYQPQMQRQQELAERQRMASVERENDWSDWVKRETWKQENAPPRYNDTIEDVKWYMGASEEEKAAYDALHPVFKIGADGMPYPMARTRPVPAPAGVTFTPLDDGGPQAPPAATFPRR